MEQSKIGTLSLDHFLSVLVPKIICKEKSLPKGLSEGPDVGYLKVQARHCFRNLLLLVHTKKAISERQARYLYPSGLLHHVTYLDEPNDCPMQYKKDCKRLTAQWWNGR